MPKHAKDHITDKVPILKKDIKVESALHSIRLNASKYETINYAYVVDEQNRLIGVLSIKELFASKKDRLIHDIMTREIVKAYPNETQERVVLRSLKYNIKAVPVVDKSERFLGVVPSDRLISILHEEATDNLMKIAGIHHHKKISDGTMSIVTARIPWILFGLIGGVLSALIIDAFSGILETLLVFVFYIPVIMNISGSIGNQAGIIYIKNRTLGMIGNWMTYFISDLKVGGAIALVSGIVMTVVETVWHGNPAIGFVIGCAMFITTATGLMIGLIIPILLERIGNDPAIGAGPVVTAFVDMSSLLIYFGVVYVLIG